jgi:hypothetical protein
MDLPHYVRRNQHQRDVLNLPNVPGRLQLTVPQSFLRAVNVGEKPYWYRMRLAIRSWDDWEAFWKTVPPFDERYLFYQYDR